MFIGLGVLYQNDLHAQDLIAAQKINSEKFHYWKIY